MEPFPPEPPPEPAPEPSQEYDPSSVNDLDTARLALRWALERLHKFNDELARVKQALAAAEKERGMLAEDAKQKDEAIRRWRETIKTWEASMADQGALERRLREELREEARREQADVAREQRAQGERQVEALKREIAERDAQIGALRRDAIDAGKTARQGAEKEIQDALAHQQKALEESKASFLERLKTQSEAVRAKEL